jgi:periplasmic protein TonB
MQQGAIPTPALATILEREEGASVLRQAQDEGGVRGKVTSNPVVSLSNHGKEVEPAASDAAPAPALSTNAGVRPPALDRADGWVWPAALSLALIAHAAVFYVLVREPADFMAGGGGQQIDAISVTMISSNVLESRELEQTPPAPVAAAASVENSDGAPQSAAAAAVEEREEKKEKPEEIKERPKEAPIREAEAIIELPQESQQESAAPSAGGAAARSDTASDARTSAPAAASPGAVREYARYVAQALAKTKPKGTGGLGTVRVKFVIAGDGGFAAVEVAKSSGSSKLDEMALGAVRRTKFLTPPSGMTTAQLTYEVPYRFR